MGGLGARGGSHSGAPAQQWWVVVCSLGDCGGRQRGAPAACPTSACRTRCSCSVEGLNSRDWVDGGEDCRCCCCCCCCMLLGGTAYVLLRGGVCVNVCEHLVAHACVRACACMSACMQGSGQRAPTTRAWRRGCAQHSHAGSAQPVVGLHWAQKEARGLISGVGHSLPALPRDECALSTRAKEEDAYLFRVLAIL